MKKRKKLVKFLIILIIIILISIAGYAYYENNREIIEVEEISVLFEEITIESEIQSVVVEEEEEEGENQDEGKSGSSNSKIKKNSSYSGTSKKKSSGSSGGTTVSTQTYTPKIQIPRTGIKYTIYSTMSPSNMDRGVCLLDTANGLNQPGNTVIAGHNLGNRKFFSRNSMLQIGDLIYITDSSGIKLRYSVYNKYVTNINDASYVERDTGGAREISLTTCTIDNANRFIVWAREM